MKHPTSRLWTVTVMVMMLTACSLLPQPQPSTLDRYLLEYAPAEVLPAAANAPVLLISTPDAHGAYATSRIAYMQQQYGLRYYVNSRWADTPANMLAPLLVDAIDAGGYFQAHDAGTGQVAAELRLDTDLTRFHQDFTVKPSVMHITMRAQLVNLREQRVLATRVFDVRVAAQSEDTYGGVQAANRALAQLLPQLVRFCNDNRP